MTTNDPGQRVMISKARRRRVALCVCAAVLVLLSLFRWVQNGPSPASAESPPPVQATEKTSTPKADKPDYAMYWQPIEVDWDIYLKQDLFDAGPVTAPSQPDALPAESNTTQAQRLAEQTLQVQAIIIGKQPRAMINGLHVCEGEIVSGYTVIQIQSNRVLVELDAQRFWIRP